MAKKVNKKIIAKEISIKKIEKHPKTPNIIVKINPTEDEDDANYYNRQSISQCRMKKFLSMTAADLPAPTTKPLACMKPILTTPKDTIRCVSCDELYNPTMKNEHLKTCMKTKPKKLYFGCAQCSFKSLKKDDVTQHVLSSHK